MVNLLPTLSKNSGKPIYEQLYEYIRSQVESGVFEVGDKLPSIRWAATSLGVSKTTVIEAYDQLLLEGYIDSRDRSGYYISASGVGGIIPTSGEQLPELSHTPSFNDRVDADSFDEKLWASLVTGVIRDHKEVLLSYGDVFGEGELRGETAKYLSGMRGVVASPTQVIIGAGMSNLVALLDRVIGEEKTIAFEDPGFYRGVQIFENLGYNCVPIPLGKEGIDVKSLYKSGAKLVFVTPSHQYPTGGVMSATTRRELVQWANTTGGYIIEDDYDSILRFHGRPIPALQGVAPDRTIHLGSFSKLVIPAVRVSYMVLPVELTKSLLTKDDIYIQPASRTEQLALAQFIAGGHFERHIRRIRKVYSAKNDKLCKLIAKEGQDLLKVVGNQSGFHLLLQVKTSDAVALKDSLAKLGIRVEVVAGFESTLLVYYSGVTDEENFFKTLFEQVKSFTN